MSGEGDADAVLQKRAQWCLIHGDCENVLKEPWSMVDHVITDPPYEKEAHGMGRRCRGRVLPGGKRELVNVVIPFAPINDALRIALGQRLARLTKRWALVFCQLEGAMLWRSALETGGHIYKRTCIWTKPDGQPQLSGDRPGMGYETIVATHSKGRSKWHGGGRLGVFTCNKADPEFATARGGGNPHPTLKPISLMLQLVELFTDPGDVVLDPFAGSGTTGVACLRLGRRFIGIEKNDDFATLAQERLRAEEMGLSLTAVRSGQEPLFP